MSRPKELMPFAAPMDAKFPDGPCEHPGCFAHVTHPCEKCGRIAGTYAIYNVKDIKSLQSQLHPLKEFVHKVIQAECWGDVPLDGFEIQELAEKLGLIESRFATEEDETEFSDFVAGDKIFTYSDILKEKRNVIV